MTNDEKPIDCDGWCVIDKLGTAVCFSLHSESLAFRDCVDAEYNKAHIKKVGYAELVEDLKINDGFTAERPIRYSRAFAIVQE